VGRAVEKSPGGARASAPRGCVPRPLCLGQGDPGGFGCGEGLFDAFGWPLQEVSCSPSMIRVGARDRIGRHRRGVLFDSPHHLGVVSVRRNTHMPFPEPSVVVSSLGQHREQVIDELVVGRRRATS